MKRLKEGEGRWIGCRGYLYKGYEVYSVYHEPDRAVIWEAVNISDGCADFHAFSKRGIKILIDKSDSENE